MKKSFAAAFRGIWMCIKTERNMKIHLLVFFYVIVVSVITKITKTELFCVLLCSCAVFAAEMINTAIENMCDEIHPDYSKHIKKAKDISAGAVLVCAIISAVIGGCIFFTGSKINEVLAFAAAYPVIAALLLVPLPVCLYFIFRRKK